MASPATAMCTPARSWLIIFTVLPAPGVSPRRQTLLAMASRTGWARSKAAWLPLAMTVMLPPRAPVEPPETGESRKRAPAASTFAARVLATSGERVVQQRTTPPWATRGMAPLGPKRTVSAWAALTTKTMRASRFSGSAAGLSVQVPPAASSSGQADLRSSQPQTSQPFAARLRAEPMPIDPRPMIPTFTPRASDLPMKNARDGGGRLWPGPDLAWGFGGDGKGARRYGGVLMARTRRNDSALLRRSFFACGAGRIVCSSPVMAHS